MKKYIDFAPAWTCENWDLLAPIDWEGFEVLWEDGARECVDQIGQDWVKASDAEVRAFYRQQGYLFEGDEVEIVSGRKLPIGARKIIKSFFDFEPVGTYGHNVTTYAVFTDGTKTAVKNVRGLEALDGPAYRFVRPWTIGGRK
jgi:hypothetical protein